MVSSGMLRSLFARKCVICPSATPSCPSCPTGSKCSISVQTCDTCQTTSCIIDPTAVVTQSNPDTPAVDGDSSHPNVGAIVSGVVGGLLALSIIVYLAWRFFVKKKSAPEKNFTPRRNARASTYAVSSIASTVLTQSSNIIQIAYIPDGTNRSAPTSSTMTNLPRIQSRSSSVYNDDVTTTHPITIPRPSSSIYSNDEPSIGRSPPSFGSDDISSGCYANIYTMSQLINTVSEESKIQEYHLAQAYITENQGLEEELER